MNTPTTRQTDYQRALHAEPRLQAIASIVDVLIELVRPNDNMCGSCIWEGIIKPLTTPLIGWERGYPPREAHDPGNAEWRLISGSDWAKEFETAEKTRTTATTDTEKWLRTPEAWDAFCGELIRRLNDADPGNGHGICKAR
ncbi:hypothetical protein [Streptomyces sp. NBC_00620]|uniref:hypothetical protein n=1 Tax=Streptomyces sp. NBC_00620 TaxID=2903666 RepID=UPI00225146EB|nr:hypothetical protein [Streptomyces sp. NBC_00620]MCX4972181.1 hypothetical protein [Streptomyces sp. NBC_00620]